MNCDTVANEMRKIAIQAYNEKIVEEALTDIKTIALDGGCSLQTRKYPKGDTLCHILRDKGFQCESVLFSDGWHTSIYW